MKKSVIIMVLFFSAALSAQAPWTTRLDSVTTAKWKEEGLKYEAFISERYDSVAQRFLPADTLSWSTYNRQGRRTESFRRETRTFYHEWRFYNSRGQQIRYVGVNCETANCDSSRKANISVATYNPQGQLVCTDHFDRVDGRDSLDSYETFDYAANGTLKEERRFRAQDGKYQEMEILQYSISGSGSVYAITRRSPYGYISSTDTVIFHSSGYLAYNAVYYGKTKISHLKVTYTPDGYPLCWREWKYNELTKTQEGPFEHCNEYSYDKKGRVIGPPGSNRPRGFIFRKKKASWSSEQRDPSGNLVERTTYVKMYR